VDDLDEVLAMSRTRVVLSGLLVSVAMAAGCGGGPTSPSAALRLSGTWTGSFEYRTGGATITDVATLSVQQPSTTASGNWSTAGLATGTISFLASGTVTGTMTISQPNVGSGPCTGSSTISGTATDTALVLTVADLTRTASCPWATGMKFTFSK
jgi:hypothetical protein